MVECVVEKEPSQDTIEQIASIAADYTRDYFTENVPDDARRDLLFQRAIFLKDGATIISFIVFTCLDGCPHITLLATKRELCGKGYAKELMRRFVSHVSDMGFRSIEVFTVLPQSKPVYVSTIAFYKSAGFRVIGEYPDLWESGAVKLRKDW